MLIWIIILSKMDALLTFEKYYWVIVRNTLE
jgi:hypothetical protein